MTNHQQLEPKRNHLLFLDGLRGLAALYVVAHHTMYQIEFTDTVLGRTEAFLHWTHWLKYGEASVDIFIVLSGFCLMLPVARGDGYLRGGFWQFAKRRALRILPAYYASLVLSLLLIWALPCLSHPDNGLWMGALPAFALGPILSHILLVHNFSPNWLHAIDYPLWSVATEWQIYFIFALILLPILRRCGIVATIAASFAVGYLPSIVTHHKVDGGLNLLVLFAFGMCAASLTASAALRSMRVPRPKVLVASCIAALVAFTLVAVKHKRFLIALFTFHDITVGIFTAIMLVLATLHTQGAIPPNKVLAGIVRTLGSRPLVVLGTFSYSLYLIHAPLIAIIFAAVRTMVSGATATFLVCELIGLPICVGLAYGFHLVFERPFMSIPRPKTEMQAEIAAVASPAP